MAENLVITARERILATCSHNLYAMFTGLTERDNSRETMQWLDSEDLQIKKLLLRKTKNAKEEVVAMPLPLRVKDQPVRNMTTESQFLCQPVNQVARKNCLKRRKIQKNC